MKDKSLDDNYKSEELVVYIEVDYELHNEESMVPTAKVGILMVSTNLVDVSIHST
jgi:hypothetical protein